MQLTLTKLREDSTMDLADHSSGAAPLVILEYADPENAFTMHLQLQVIQPKVYRAARLG